MSQMIPEELEEFVTITIPQEDGTEQEFAIVDSFNADGSHYIVVSRVEGDLVYDDDAYIYRAKETETDVDVEPINDEEEYKKVIEAYEATFENN